MTAASSRSRRAKFAIATTVTLLPALAILAIQASPVSAQEESYTLNVSTQGNGKVTAEGIDCGNGGSDCSETYPVSYQQVCEPNPDPPPAQFCYLEPIYQEVTPTSSPAPGWQFQGWGGACSGTGPCALTMGQNHSVSATFIRVSPPNDDFDNAQPISGTSVSVNGTNVNATREESDPWTNTKRQQLGLVPLDGALLRLGDRGHLRDELRSDLLHRRGRLLRGAAGDLHPRPQPGGQRGAGVTYTATVSTAAKDLAGNTLARTKSWAFTVQQHLRRQTALRRAGAARDLGPLCLEEKGSSSAAFCADGVLWKAVDL